MRISVALRSVHNSVLCLFLFACGGGGGSDGGDITDTPAPAQPPSAVESLQQVVDSAASSIDGIIVYVDEAGKEPQWLSSGISDRETSAEITNGDLFKIASISKLFIAVAATKLVNENVIRMEDTLAMWLPELVDDIANAETITLEMMLRHRSGIPDFDSQVGFSWENAHSDIDATLQFALNLPADFSPDARFEYSNTNYLLIGKVLDTALGFSHEEYIKTDILTPLGLSNTYLQASEANIDSIVSGYWLGENRKAQDYVIPGGSMVSTAEDVAVFLRALNTGELLTLEEKSIYPYFLNHSGWVPGYQSIANYYSDINAVVIQFINTTGGTSETTASTTQDEIVAWLRSN